MERGSLIAEGKAKTVYSVANDSKHIWMEFRNSLTAFNGVKKEEILGKGELNNKISTLIFKYLAKNKIESHWISSPSNTTMICKKVKIIPLEVVTRNVLAGSTAKKFKIEEGTAMKAPLVELYYKDDALGDPFISDEQALFLGAVKETATLKELKEKALAVNSLLQKLFKEIGVTLVDFKLEFGWSEEGKVLLADEVTPDTCRLWDQKTNEKLDKDRFRRDLGRVLESYQEIYDRLQTHLEKHL